MNALRYINRSWRCALGIALLAIGPVCTPASTGGTGDTDPPPTGNDPIAGRLANDQCSAPKAIGDGTITFSTTEATTDGPQEPGACTFFDYSHVEADSWFCYTADCDGEVLISLCGSSYDSKMAVYSNCACPSGDPLACNDDGCGLSTASRVQFQARRNQSYLIRIGGFEGARGDGIITVKCNDASQCGDPDAGDCFGGTTSAYCDNATCCQTVCEQDWYCCDVEWDSECGAQAFGFCNGEFQACASGTGNCNLAQGGTGCGDGTCCQVVCEIEPFCCLNVWDEICAEIAKRRCGPLDPVTDPVTDPTTDPDDDPADSPTRPRSLSSPQGMQGTGEEASSAVTVPAGGPQSGS